jgi:hypothetical protein
VQVRECVDRLEALELQLQSTDRNDHVFQIPFFRTRLSGGQIPFSESDYPGWFRRRIKTWNCRVRQTDARTHRLSDFIYSIDRLVQKFQKSVQTLIINNCKHFSHFLQMVVPLLCHGLTLKNLKSFLGRYEIWHQTPTQVNQFVTVGADSFKNIPLFIPGWLQNLSTRGTSLLKTLQKHIFITMPRYGTKTSNIHKVGSNWAAETGTQNCDCQFLIKKRPNWQNVKVVSLRVWRPT